MSRAELTAALASRGDALAADGRARQCADHLVGLRIPTPKPHTGTAYLRCIPRNEMDIAVVGAGAAVILEDNGTVFRSVRLALGAVAPTPLLVTAVGDFLRNEF